MYFKRFLVKNTDNDTFNLNIIIFIINFHHLFTLHQNLVDEGAENKLGAFLM